MTEGVDVINNPVPWSLGCGTSLAAEPLVSHCGNWLDKVPLTGCFLTPLDYFPTLLPGSLPYFPTCVFFTF